MASRDAGQRGWRHAWGVPSRTEKWLCISYTRCGDTVVLLGYNADQEKPSSAITNVSSLTLILKTEAKEDFEAKGVKPEPTKVSPRIEGFKPSLSS